MVRKTRSHKKKHNHKVHYCEDTLVHSISVSTSKSAAKIMLHSAADISVVKVFSCSALTCVITMCGRMARLWCINNICTRWYNALLCPAWWGEETLTIRNMITNLLYNTHNTRAHQLVSQSVISSFGIGIGDANKPLISFGLRLHTHSLGYFPCEWPKDVFGTVWRV